LLEKYSMVKLKKYVHTARDKNKYSSQIILKRS